MQRYLVRIILIAAYLWSGAAWNTNTNEQERGALSTILVEVKPTQKTPSPTSNMVIPPFQIAKPVSQPASNLGPIPQNPLKRRNYCAKWLLRDLHWGDQFFGSVGLQQLSSGWRRATGMLGFNKEYHRPMYTKPGQHRLVERVRYL